MLENTLRELKEIKIIIDKTMEPPLRELIIDLLDRCVIDIDDVSKYAPALFINNLTNNPHPCLIQKAAIVLKGNKVIKNRFGKEGIIKNEY